MRYLWPILLLANSVASHANSEAFQENVTPLIDSSCIHCHDSASDSRLNFENLTHNLNSPATFRQWQKIYDRVLSGDMPPATENRPDSAHLNAALDSLKKHLTETSLAIQQKRGRVGKRRLTRLEYGYTLKDLLHIEQDFATLLPEETDSLSFDTVAANQGISSVHILSYLKATDRALDAAIQLNERPESNYRLVDYYNSPYVNRWYDIPLKDGGGVIKKLHDAHRAPLAFKAILSLPQPTAFKTLARGFQGQCPCCRRTVTEAHS